MCFHQFPSVVCGIDDPVAPFSVVCESRSGALLPLGMATELHSRQHPAGIAARFTVGFLNFASQTTVPSRRVPARCRVSILRHVSAFCHRSAFRQRRAQESAARGTSPSAPWLCPTWPKNHRPLWVATLFAVSASSSTHALSATATHASTLVRLVAAASL